MADTKLSDLTALAAIVPANLLLYVVDSSEAVLANKSKKAAYTLLEAYNDARYASLAQGITADSAVQPGDLALVATTGDYGDLSNPPTLGTIASQNANNVSISGGSISGITDLAIADGGTGQSTAQAAINALTAVSGATIGHVLTKSAGGDAAWEASAGGGGSSLPVVDETAIVYKTGDVAITQTHDINAYSAARIVSWPDVAMTPAGLGVANVFTTLQKINVANALALLVEQDGVRDNVLVVDTTNGRVGVLTAPATYNFEVIGITDAATAIFNSVSSSIATRVVIQGTAANGNADNTDPILSLRNRSGVQVAAIREDGLVASSFLGTLDNASVFLVDDSVDTVSYPKGVNLGSAAILGWSNGASWFNGKDITLSRTAAGQLRILCEDAVTSTAPDTFTVSHNTSGTPAAGFGSGLVVLGESSTTINQYMARLSTTWATATHASRKARSVWTVYDTAEREGIRIEADGSAPMLGVLGAAAIARQAHIVDPSGGGTQDAEARTAINAILAALESFGFLATS